MPVEHRRACHDTHNPMVPGECPVCWRAAHVRFYQRRWGLPETGEFEEVPRSPVVRVALPTRPPCAHLGRELTGAERDSLGLPHAKQWHECDKGHGLVCPCQHCKTCPDYEADRGE